ncbi:MAG: hypothetical protein CMJ35_08955 [Phycisphaerae bacterium]|nr:hypothetical protein [Phycisphaerae bacterium]
MEGMRHLSPKEPGTAPSGHPPVSQTCRIKHMEDKQSRFESIVNLFTTRLHAAHKTTPMLYGISGVLHNFCKHNLEEFKKQHVNKNKEFDRSALAKHNDIRIAYDDTGTAMQALYPSTFVAMVSQYDFLVSQCIREICTLKPEILNNSEKQLKYSEILSFEDFDEVKQWCLEETIEQVMRKNHEGQIEWIEKQLSCKLRPEDPVWKSFIESTQRRHLYVHTGGAVSDSYLKICRGHGIDFPPEVTQGVFLAIDQHYLTNTFTTLLIMGTLLSQVLWRKFAPDELELADKQINLFSYRLIDYNDYDSAIWLLKFAKNDIKKYSTENYRLSMLFNLAQAYKWKGENELCYKTIENLDPTALPSRFSLAYYSLTDDYANAKKAATAVIKAEELAKEDLCEWPIFKDFRQQNEFTELMQELFDEEWTPPTQDGLRTPFERMLSKWGVSKVGIEIAMPEIKSEKQSENTSPDTDLSDPS